MRGEVASGVDRDHRPGGSGGGGIRARVGVAGSVDGDAQAARRAGDADERAGGGARLGVDLGRGPGPAAAGGVGAGDGVAGAVDGDAQVVRRARHRLGVVARAVDRGGVPGGRAVGGVRGDRRLVPDGDAQGARGAAHGVARRTARRERPVCSRSEGGRGVGGRLRIGKLVVEAVAPHHRAQALRQARDASPPGTVRRRRVVVGLRLPPRQRGRGCGGGPCQDERRQECEHEQ